MFELTVPDLYSDVDSLVAFYLKMKSFSFRCLDELDETTGA